MNYEKIKEHRIQALIRRKYSFNDELAILRQRDSKPEEFREYFDYCEQCKSQTEEYITVLKKKEETKLNEEVVNE